jgi:hypothetical protein
VANSNRAAAAAKAAQLRADEARKERQRKQVIAAVVAVVVVLGAVVVGLIVSGNKTDTPAAPSTTAATSFLTTMTSVPASAFDAAGAPAADSLVPSKIADGAPLMQDGKPKVVYVGAEFCPYCATERWALVAALSRFGTFDGLAATRSAESDGNIPTVTFTKATYKSDYVAFQSVETKDRDGQPLQTMPADLETLYTKLNKGGGIPWTYFGTAQASGSGVLIQPFTTLSGDDAWTTIAGQMATGTGEYGQPIDAHANVITAQLCQLTGNKPANVCSSAGVTAAAALLGK